MKTYARIDGSTVAEIIHPLADSENNEIPIVDRFTAELVASMVDITAVMPQPEQGWSYDGTAFHPFIAQE